MTTDFNLNVNIKSADLFFYENNKTIHEKIYSILAIKSEISKKNKNFIQIELCSGKSTTIQLCLTKMQSKELVKCLSFLNDRL